MSGSDITNLTSNGVPVWGLITSGKSFFVDPVNGSNSNTGERIDRALKSIEVAYDLCRDGKNDVVYYLPGATAPTTLGASGLVWQKSYTHLVGLGAPVGFAQRSRQFCTAGVSVPTMIEFAGQGCIVKNIYFFHGLANNTSKVCGNVTGSRNYFENVHFAGIGDATMDVAGACSLKVDGGSENKFKNCSIGLDTIARGANSSEILFDSKAKRNVFEDCVIYAMISAAAHSLVKAADSEGTDMFNIFKRCLFLSESVNNATAMNQAFDISPSITNYVILQDCMAVGITAWDAAGNGKIYNNTAAPAASAGGGIATVL